VHGLHLGAWDFNAIYQKSNFDADYAGEIKGNINIITGDRIYQAAWYD
jgi:hypothetical protein